MSTTNFSLSLLKSKLTGSFDMFMCSASYESRCRSIPDNLDKANLKTVCIARNFKPAPPLEENIKYLEQKFPHHKSIQLDKNKPTVGGDRFYAALGELFIGGPKRVLIDITTFTHEAVLILYRVLVLLARKEDEIIFSYVGAEEYSPGVPDEDKWLSKGIREIRSVLGYPGGMLPSRKIHLIVLVGHETERARILIDAYEPSLISVGFCTEQSSISSKNFATNQHFHKRLISLYPDCKTFNFSANCVFETKSAVITQQESFPNYNVVVAPMNSKLSALGAALAALEQNEIQLCYAQPELYNYENYSIPKDVCYLFCMPGVGKDISFV